MSSERELYFDKLGIPRIYCYTTPEFENAVWSSDSSKKGFIKVGYTLKQSVEERIKQQFPVITPHAKPYKVLFVSDAIKDNGDFFSDNQKGGVHEGLIKLGRKQVNGEWFECTVDDVKNVILSIKTDLAISRTIVENFKMRPEQHQAVKITSDYFKKNINKTEKAPHFLWNAKMRFGKTFSTYQLIKKMDWKNVLVLTYKPAVEQEWREQLEQHIDFDKWQFLGRGDNYDDFNNKNPLIWFTSFQDILGKNIDGNIKEKHEPAYKINWDCIVLDEYHFGAWNESSKELYDSDFSEKKPDIEFSEDKIPLNSDSFLYLSGTPFRALNEGEFLEDQIFTWSYIDEQKAKSDWNEKELNPYLELPKMVMMTYEMPPELKEVALRGEMNEFDLNEFFRAELISETEEESYEFIHKNEVQKWLSLITGQYLQGGYSPDSGIKKPPLPFDDAELLTYMNHTFWFLPNVASCYAMRDLLNKPQNNYFHEFNIVLAAGPKAGNGLDALPPVRQAIDNGLKTKSITLSCMKLTTGVTVPEWCAIFMLRNTSSPETYFQTAFRVQSPWVYKDRDTSQKAILKTKCYVFDFAPNRALKLIQEYSMRINSNNKLTVEEKVKDLLNFIPVLQYDNYSMRALDAKELLDFAASGIGATMLARRWQSQMLVRVDNDTLERILNNKNVLNALENIEAFRNLGKDITKVINSEKALSKIEREQKPKSPENKKEEKENRGFKKLLKEKLLKFITRVPAFMYLTDFREESLRDVITQLEQDLFKKVTGLEIKDFEELCNIGVFNYQLMDSAIYNFRKYEEASLNYVGGGTLPSRIGLFESTISSFEEL